MITGILIAAVLAAPGTPQSVLKGALDHYKTLNSFSMKIEHKDSSGLFPGSYKQSLKWLKSGPFELVVTKPSGVEQKPSVPGMAAPNYYYDGGQEVVSIWRDRPNQSSPLAHDENIMPGWEVSGGLILSALLRSPDAEIIFKMPPNFKLTWSFGKTTEWKGEAVREVCIHAENQMRSDDVRYFVSKDGRHLVGFAWTAPGISGWAHYAQQVENGPMPKGLGLAPKGK